MKMSVGVLDHYTVSTRKLNETVQFYEDVLGFMNGPRPPFNFLGAWLYSAGHPVLRISTHLPNRQAAAPPIQAPSIISRLEPGFLRR